MAYKYDEDLEFLRQVDSEDLNELVYVLTHDKDGEVRFSESLTNDDLYKRFYPEHKEYLDLILEELQTFGGNSIINVFRGGGVKYKEILCDVCDKMKVNYNKNSKVENIEQGLFMKILEDATKEMNTEDLKKLVEELKLNTTNYTPQAVMAGMQILIKQGGFRSYQIMVIVVNAIWRAIFGRGLSLAANATATRVMSIFAGPIGWAITGIWTAFDLAGPAYRVTIPAVIQVAYLRLVYLHSQDKDENEE